jgi:hypothetical protein
MADETVATIARVVDAGEAITRADAERLIRAIERRCRGRLGSRVNRPEDDESVRAERETQLRGNIKTALAEDKLAEARAIDGETRAACGYDFNATILAGALDGEEHAFTCPRCGVTGSYRAPRIVIAEAP